MSSVVVNRDVQTRVWMRGAKTPSRAGKASEVLNEPWLVALGDCDAKRER